jgi:hypothetical protein
MMTKCLKAYPTAPAALRRIRNRPHSCVYHCQACGFWHTNHTGRPARHELYRDHIVGYSDEHQLVEPQKPHCEVCAR